MAFVLVVLGACLLAFDKEKAGELSGGIGGAGLMLLFLSYDDFKNKET